MTTDSSMITNKTISLYPQPEISAKQEVPDIFGRLCQDLQNKILSYFDIPVIKTTMEVSKRWNIIATHPFIWNSFARSLTMQSQLINIYIVKENIIKIKSQTRNIFLAPRVEFLDRQKVIGLIQTDIKFKCGFNELLASEKVNDILKVQEIRKAGEILLFWYELLRQVRIHVDVSFMQFNSTSELLEKAAEFKEWCTENLVDLANVKEMDLSGRQLTFLPPEIGLLKNLKILNLSTNHLTSLCPEIGKLANLEKLLLSWNQLTELSREIGMMTNLNSLSLHHNLLTTLPSEIGLLKNLQMLNIEDNPLTSLPREITKLPWWVQLRAITALIEAKAWKGPEYLVSVVDDVAEALTFLKL